MTETKKIAIKIKKKISLPTFRGRFGKKSVRKITNKKWKKWRKVRGLDADLKKEYGAIPKIGYGAANEIKHMHPSGRKPIIIKNQQELEKADKTNIIVISKTVGERKRQIIIKKADELGLKISNDGKPKKLGNKKPNMKYLKIAEDKKKKILKKKEKKKKKSEIIKKETEDKKKPVKVKPEDKTKDAKKPTEKLEKKGEKK